MTPFTETLVEVKLSSILISKFFISNFVKKKNLKKNSLKSDLSYFPKKIIIKKLKKIWHRFNNNKVGPRDLTKNWNYGTNSV